MHRSLLPLFCSLAAISAAAFALAPRGESSDPIPVANGEPVLLELFTSQGCSSCPPADRLAARLAQETGLVVVSRPVTYWDRLGWKDTLAREENTTLQRQYARRGLSGRNGVYTPQLVIDGQIGVVGSQERAIRLGTNAARASDTAALRVRRLDSGGWIIGIGGQSTEEAELALLSIASKADVAIARGENSGREITYTNVVKHERVIASWQGGPHRVTLTQASLDVQRADQYALVLREPCGGRILASRWLR